jgi:hypothetical protein
MQVKQHMSAPRPRAELGLRARMSCDLRQVLAVIADRLGC